MNRQEIKIEAKKKVKGNIWNILWPLLVIGVLESVITSLCGGNIQIDPNNLENLTIPTSYYVVTGVVGILMGIANAGYLKYLINFVRTGSFDTNEILNTIKEKWLNILIANILVGIIVGACTMLFIVPGIIMALAYTFVTYLVVDTDTTGSDALARSRGMMKGYKGDYFVFILSFIGWFLLVPITFGLILIWLIPYFNVATVLYYDKLKEIRQIN